MIGARTVSGTQFHSVLIIKNIITTGHMISTYFSEDAITIYVRISNTARV
jgi:hypothetical protein